MEAYPGALDGLELTKLCHSSETAQIFRGTCRWVAGPVAIKCYADSAHGLRQHHTLERFHAIVSCREWSAPRPITVLNDGAVSVMEWVEAPSLHALLRNHRVRKRVLVRELERAGIWLYRLHQLGGLKPGRLNVEKRLAHLEDLLARYPVPVEIDRARGLLLDTAPAAGAVEVAQANTLHGDFKPINILIGKARIVGLDFSWELAASVIADVVHFANHVELLCLKPVYLRLARRTLISAFLSGYGEFPILPYRWLRVQNLLRMWARKPRSGLENAVTTHVLAKMTADLHAAL